MAITLPFASLQAMTLIGKRFVVRLDAWDRSSPCPNGHLVHTIGKILEPSCETEAVLVQCGVPWGPFCAAALAELPAREREGHGDGWAWQVRMQLQRWLFYVQ